MKILAVVSLALFALLLQGAHGAEKAPELKREILGVRINMPKADVEKRLKEIGKFVRDERKRQQIWEVRDERFSHVIVGFDSKEKLRYVTAVAREDKDAKRVEYSDIGVLQQAHQAGDPAINNFNFEWRLEPTKEDAEAMVVARGRDPKFLSTYSLKKLGGEKEEEDEKKPE